MARRRGRKRRGGRHPHPTHHTVRAHTRVTATGRKTRVKSHRRRHPVGGRGRGRGRRGGRGRSARAAAPLF